MSWEAWIWGLTWRSDRLHSAPARVESGTAFQWGEHGACFVCHENGSYSITQCWEAG